MRALIIGMGYVGQAVAAELLARGHTVTGIRRSFALGEIAGSPGFRRLSADVTDPATLSQLRTPVDWVVNCVAASGGSPEQYRATYLEGTRNVLRWLAQGPPAKYVYTSSTGVYGQTDGSLVDELSETKPVTETGRILVETEQLLLGPPQSIPAIVLRVAGIYGPGRGYWFRQFLSGEAKIEGQGTRVLNMIHRDDLVIAILAALERGRPGEAYNVVDNEPASQRDVFAWLSRHLGQPLPPSVPESGETSRRRGHTNKRVSNAKLRRELGCSWRYPTFREGFSAELERLRNAESSTNHG
jgi:nucleoside-diphosphate-sugar epimerase